MNEGIRYFIDRGLVEEQKAKETIQRPDKSEDLAYGLRLRVKHFNDGHLKHLLIGSDLRKQQEDYLFAYWIPQDIYSETVEPHDLLELFVNHFSATIKFMDEEARLIKNKVRFWGEELKDYGKLYKLKFQGGLETRDLRFVQKINDKVHLGYYRYSIHLLYAINVYKYEFWFMQLPFSEIDIRAGWYDYVKTFVDFSNPKGKTQFDIQISSDHERQTNIAGHETIIKISVPNKYKGAFNQIVKSINELKDGEFINIGISNVKQTCIFCGDDDLSDEHIIPTWMKGYFEQKSIVPQGLVPNQNPGEKFHIVSNNKKDSVQGFTTSHHVCVTCNNEWMSEMENLVKPILTHPTEDRLRTFEEIDFSQESKQALTHWILVKAILVLFKQMGRTALIPVELIKGLKDKIFPSDLIVEAADALHYGVKFMFGRTPNTGQYNVRVKKMDEEKAHQMLDKTFVFSLQFGHVMFRVSFSSDNAPFRRVKSGIETEVVYPEGLDMKFFPMEDEVTQSHMKSELARLLLFNIGLIYVEK